MSRQSMLDEIASDLRARGVPYACGGAADITIDVEYLKAGWSTGKRKITYQASVLADERAQTVYMWELTTEKGSGFSFGASGESTFQSGATLYRKIKSVQYGPDGKAYEYAVDLGANAKAVRRAAKHAGWRFKTVVRREKAAYPVR